MTHAVVSVDRETACKDIVEILRMWHVSAVPVTSGDGHGRRRLGGRPAAHHAERGRCIPRRHRRAVDDAPRRDRDEGRHDRRRGPPDGPGPPSGSRRLLPPTPRGSPERRHHPTR
ncbi:hypothetical protein [Streptomyces racemochromogenes]